MGQAVAWIGQDGNLYYGTGIEGDPVQNWGSADNYQFAEGGITALNHNTPLGQGPGFAPNVQQIDDPNARTTDQVSGTDLNQAAIDNTLKAVESLGTEFSTGNKNIDDSYNAIVGKYDRERTQNKGDYDQNVLTNTQNLTKNRQNALLAASQGRRGLRGVLASLGALGGTGDELADRAVTAGANQDTGQATDTFVTNSQNLDKAWSRFDQEDKDRREEAQTSRTNQKTGLEGTIATKRQGFFQKLAELFGDSGNTAEATNYLNRAGDLNDIIARSSRVASTPFTAQTAAFTPKSLENYLAGAGDLTVSVGPGGGGGLRLPGGIFAGRTNPRKRKEDEEPVA